MSKGITELYVDRSGLSYRTEVWTENFLNVISGFLESPIGEDGISDKQQAQYHMKNEDAEDSINRGFRNHIRRCKCFCS